VKQFIQKFFEKLVYLNDFKSLHIIRIGLKDQACGACLVF